MPFLTLTVACSGDDADPIRSRDLLPQCPPAGLADPDGGPVTPPVRIESSYVPPIYPEAARQAREEGKVHVRSSIDTDGIVCGAEITLSDNPGWKFEEFAIEAIAQWEYEPAMQGEKPVSDIITVIVDYTIQGPSARDGPSGNEAAVSITIRTVPFPPAGRGR